MGFISFLTADTRESIRNVYTGEAKLVYLLQPGLAPSIEERSYEGYGVFGGVDVFVWLATHNLSVEDLRRIKGDSETLREIGCQMENSNCDFPLKFSFDENAVYENLPASEIDPAQGFF